MARGRQIAWMIAGSVCLGIGFYLSSAPLKERSRLIKEREKTIPIECIITSAYIKEEEDGDGSTLYCPTFEFYYVINGERYQFENQMECSYDEDDAREVLSRHPRAQDTCYYYENLPEVGILERRLKFDIWNLITPIAFSMFGILFLWQGLTYYRYPLIRTSEKGEVYIYPGARWRFLLACVAGIIGLSIVGLGLWIPGQVDLLEMCLGVAILLLALIFLFIRVRWTVARKRGYLIKEWWLFAKWQTTRYQLSLFNKILIRVRVEEYSEGGKYNVYDVILSGDTDLVIFSCNRSEEAHWIAQRISPAFRLPVESYND